MSDPTTQARWRAQAEQLIASLRSRDWGCEGCGDIFCICNECPCEVCEDQHARIAGVFDALVRDTLQAYLQHREECALWVMSTPNGEIRFNRPRLATGIRGFEDRRCTCGLDALLEREPRVP